MILTIDDKQFMREMNNIIQYAEGFIEGAKRGKSALLTNVGKDLKFMIGQYIDSSARVNPESLHHVYEWYRTGSADARLFDINYLVAGNGLSIGATLRQSTAIREGFNVPFRNKAYIMENGISVRISPKNSPVLAFEDGGEEVFTRKSISVINPGGDMVEGSFESIFREFFVKYLSQSTIFSSGLSHNLNNPVDFSKNLRAGASGGRPVGIRTGQTWISRSGN